MDTVTPTTKDELIECLAARQHQIIGMTKLRIAALGRGKDGSYDVLFPKWSIDDLMRDAQTPYELQDKRNKESDRAQVQRYWPLIVEFVAEWVASHPEAVRRGPRAVARVWREEMSW